jgi:SsrA-binding protein
VRQGTINLKDSYCTIKNGEIFVQNLHISPYEKGNIFNKDPLRPKRLLMHKREIMKLYGQIKQEGLTLIPLTVYFKGPLVKLELGLCKGKKMHDKRESTARKEIEREMDRKMKEKNS